MAPAKTDKFTALRIKRKLYLYIKNVILIDMCVLLFFL